MEIQLTRVEAGALVAALDLALGTAERCGGAPDDNHIDPQHMGYCPGEFAALDRVYDRLQKARAD